MNLTNVGGLIVGGNTSFSLSSLFEALGGTCFIGYRDSGNGNNFSGGPFIRLYDWTSVGTTHTFNMLYASGSSFGSETASVYVMVFASNKAGSGTRKTGTAIVQATKLHGGGGTSSVVHQTDSNMTTFSFGYNNTIGGISVSTDSDCACCAICLGSA